MDEYEKYADLRKALQRVEKFHHPDVISSWCYQTSSVRALLEDYDRLREALMGVTAHLAAAASAYRTHASRDRSIRPKSVADAFFTTRVNDFDAAVERARVVLIQEWGENK